MGTNDLVGLEFLHANKIEGCSCDLSKNFAFISYAHDRIDMTIVRLVFNRLHEMGWNLWIDTANIPIDENSWKVAATKALLNPEKTCKLALFFRSEESLIREPIRKELEMISERDNIKRIVTIDIFHENTTASNYKKQLIKNSESDKYIICDAICTLVNEDNKAIRWTTEAESDINKLVQEISRELKKENIYREEKTVSEDSSNKEVALKHENVISSSPDTSNSGGNLWRYTNRKGANATVIWKNEYTKKCIIQKGSRIAEEAASFATSAPAASCLKQELLQKGIIVNGIFQMDYPSDRISTMINLIGGGSINMRGEIQKGAFRPINMSESMTPKNINENNMVATSTGVKSKMNQILKVIEKVGEMPKPIVDYSRAFSIASDEVSKELQITKSSVVDKCQRQLKLNAQEFRELLEKFIEENDDGLYNLLMSHAVNKDEENAIRKVLKRQ